MTRLAAVVVLAAAIGISGGSPAEAASVEYIPGKDVVVGQCKGWLNRRTSDGYVQAMAQSWGPSCVMKLQRIQNDQWTSASHEYHFKNTTVRTGFHWNGTGAGSRVCVKNEWDMPAIWECGAIAW